MEGYDNENRTTGIRRQGQGAGDTADVCDVLCPRYVISFFLFFFITILIFLQCILLTMVTMTVTQQLGSWRQGQEAQDAADASQAPSTCFFLVFFTLLIFYSVFYLLQQQ